MVSLSSPICASCSWLRKPIKAVLSDIHGVIYTDSGDKITPIPRSVESLNKLIGLPTTDSGIPLRLLSNGSAHSPDEVFQRCRNLGLKIKRNELLTPPPVALQLMKNNKFRPFLLVDKQMESYFAELDQSNPNCVLMADASENFTYDSLNAAFRILINNPEAPLYSMGQGRYYEGPEGEGLFLDVGPFMKALEFASGKKAHVIGKPSAFYFETVLKDLNLSFEDVVMIGDDVANDVGGAQAIGIRGILVKTGKYRFADEKTDDVTPDAIVDDLSEAVNLILESRN